MARNRRQRKAAETALERYRAMIAAVMAKMDSEASLDSAAARVRYYTTEHNRRYHNWRKSRK